MDHFLLVCFPVQSSINPLLNLAHRLVHAGAHVTFSTTIAAHKCMFPASSMLDFPLNDPHTNRLTYFPYSDGNNETKQSNYFLETRDMCRRSLRSIASAPSIDGRPAITFVIYTIVIPWVPEVAAELGLPMALLWTQPATIFSIYYHYFHGGYKELIVSHSDDQSYCLQFPGVSPISIRDLPSYLVPKPESDKFEEVILGLLEEMFLNKRTTVGVHEIVLVNSFHDLEHDVFMSIDAKLNVIPIGPLLPSPIDGGILPENIVKETNDVKEYMEFLNRWPANSVIYLSFGSIYFMKKEQNTEFSLALRDSGRPYLWVVRGAKEGVEVNESVEKGTGLVISWCSQVDVLSHNAVGCFVTHFSWNSTLESIASGVPMIGLPQCSDQPTNVELVKGTWKNGVKAKVGEDGVLKSSELCKCLETVMGDGERGKKIRENAKMWKEKTSMSVMDGGSSDLNLMNFIKDIAKCKPSYV
ncbi:Flavonoid glucosyltransferase, family GT1 [Zostera marina]|uniref:Flavonoid glucosyltransferase, family GT1 n=1 Tax=Zostera marina TaxID=29655 RepID=A0A0K9NRH6_ZOSMR|nr:Flavonoid glucosyltransferase, family GT1 [Zostera marina]